MARKKNIKFECIICHGKGKIKILSNSSDYHYNGDDPIVEDQPCEECDGTGKVSSGELNWDKPKGGEIW